MYCCYSLSLFNYKYVFCPLRLCQSLLFLWNFWKWACHSLQTATEHNFVASSQIWIWIKADILSSSSSFITFYVFRLGSLVVAWASYWLGWWKLQHLMANHCFSLTLLRSMYVLVNLSLPTFTKILKRVSLFRLLLRRRQAKVVCMRS